ncbi:MAG: hypothetical protein LQ346_008465 [Caloplaca aetnensis]|nr:MAG: hypothetical protein LQ346_008465 [Caloplaca aetnensis]
MPYRCQNGLQTWYAFPIAATWSRGKLKAVLGVTKTYKLTYEAAKVERALFNHQSAKNKWRIGANALKSFLEYFGATTEQLDICTEDGRVAFTSYTEKITHGKEILKHPLETSIALDTHDFEEFSVEEKMHIAISVKDFRAVVLHAETLRTSVQASYSFPTRPMQLAYNEVGMQCEFTLMTIGTYRGSSTTPAPVAEGRSTSLAREDLSTRQVSTPPTQASNNLVANNQDSGTMPPPSQPASRSFARFSQANTVPEERRQETLIQQASRDSPPPPKASMDPHSLFLPTGGAEDEQWDEANYGDEEEVVGWDANANSDVSSLPKAQGASAISSHYQSLPAFPEGVQMRIAPTQRLSEASLATGTSGEEWLTKA